MISPQLLIDPSILEVFDRHGGYMALWDSDTELPGQLLQDLENIGCAHEHLDFIKTIRAQGSSVTRWITRVPRNRDQVAQLLLENRKEINDIVATYIDSPVCILDSAEASGSDYTDDPDVYVSVNFDGHDEHDSDVILCLSKPLRTSFLTGETPRCLYPHEYHAACAELLLKLEALLGCSVDVCNGRGLQTGNPITYSKTRLTKGSEPYIGRQDRTDHV